MYALTIIAMSIGQQPQPLPTTTCTFTVYSYETRRHGVLHSHSWAVFTSSAGQKVTISWGPAGGSMLSAVRRPVPGRNYSHRDTRTWAISHRLRVDHFGPYPCSAALFAQAAEQARVLQSGQVQYVMLDERHRSRYTANCVGALLWIPGVRPPRTGMRHGVTGSAAVARYLLGK